MTQHRDTILMAASQEFIHQGYAATSLASIAARIGLTKGALARLFPSKEQLAWGIIDAVHTLLEGGAPGFRTPIRAAVSGRYLSTLRP